MKYRNVYDGIFGDRPNRFTANVVIDGKNEVVHVKNTGRCAELLLPKAEVFLTKSENPRRKTKYDLIAVKKKNFGYVNIDSMAPNEVVGEWLKTRPDLFADITYIKPEYTFGDSRIDFYAEGNGRKVLMEVKGCTLERNGVGYFPDAPTERGVKHLNELAAAGKDYECYIAFVIAMPDVEEVLPNDETHPGFGIALRKAEEAGVKVLYLMCDVGKDEIRIRKCKVKGCKD